MDVTELGIEACFSVELLKLLIFDTAVILDALVKCRNSSKYEMMVFEAILLESELKQHPSTL